MYKQRREFIQSFAEVGAMSAAMLAISAAISGLFALVVNFRFPAFGGISTQAATVFFGAVFLFSLSRGMPDRF